MSALQFLRVVPQRVELREIALVEHDASFVGQFLHEREPRDELVRRISQRGLGVEAEFARRTGNLAYRTALGEYIATLAGDIETAAFGARPAIGAVAGFDGMPVEDEKDRPRRSNDRSRSR